jgi:carboxynorspermidine decarboxylase
MSESLNQSTYKSIPSPSFVLEEKKLIKNLELIDHVQKSAAVSIILALKGFAMWSCFDMIRGYLKSATASSLNEAKLCTEKFGKKAHTYAVAYTDNEFEELAHLSSHLTFNSLAQFDRFSTKIPAHLSVGLRVNPEWSDVTTDLYNPAHSNSRLGLVVSSLPEILPDKIEGLHFHVLCESSAESLVTVLDHFEKKFSKYFHQIKWINMGGGHLMTSEGYNIELLISTLKKFKEKYQIAIILEPGCAVAWQTGFLKTSVIDIISNEGISTAIIDASFTCHMPDCLEMPYRPFIVEGSRDEHTHEFPYRLGGVSCLAGDYLEAYSFQNTLKVGDSITFCDMMHYTMVKTSMFNGVKHPSIVLLKADDSYQLLREFTYEDYRDRLS